MEENYSWVRRAKFSHTVCHLMDGSRLPAIPFSEWFDSVPDAMGSSLHPNPSGRARSLNPKQRFQLSIPPFQSNSKDSVLSRDHGNGRLKPDEKLSSPPPPVKYFGSHKLGPSSRLDKLRSLSPLPTAAISDEFKEARLDTKRFSTPPSRIKEREMGLLGKLFSRDQHQRSTFASSSPARTSQIRSRRTSVKASEETKSKKETTGTKSSDRGGGKVHAEQIENWAVDLSELYIGLKFASGANSRLYHGTYRDQPVAVKIITQPDDDDNGEVMKRLEREFSKEVTLLSRLSHRNVVKLVGACRTPVFCIITQFLSGGSLRAFLHKLEHKPVPLDKMVSIALNIARGIEYLHSEGVIHRDLKPENIIFDQDLHPKIVDFGIACEEAHCDMLAKDIGTYRYMAPEMIKRKPYGRKIDVYSFGLILWEMISGTIPYEGMTPHQAAFAVVDKNLKPAMPAACPPPLRDLIEQCWEQPEKRPEFSQIRKFLRRFEKALALNDLDNLAYVVVPVLPLVKATIASDPKIKSHVGYSFRSGMPKLL